MRCAVVWMGLKTGEITICHHCVCSVQWIWIFIGCAQNDGRVRSSYASLWLLVADDDYAYDEDGAQWEHLSWWIYLFAHKMNSYMWERERWPKTLFQHMSHGSNGKRLTFCTNRQHQCRTTFIMWFISTNSNGSFLLARPKPVHSHRCATQLAI